MPTQTARGHGTRRGPAWLLRCAPQPTAPSLGDTFARAIATPPSRRNRGKMKFSAAGPAGSYGKGPLYGNTFARAKASAHGKGGGGAPQVCAPGAPDNRIGEGGGASAECRVRSAGTDCQLPISNFQLGSRSSRVFAAQGLTDFGAVGKRSVSFRNFPFRSVLFRPFPCGSERTPYCLVPGAWCRAGSAECGVRSAEGPDRNPFPLFVRVACPAKPDSRRKTRKALTRKDLRVSGPLRNFPFRSETFRFVPFRSEVFRFFPFCSVWFRVVPGGGERVWTRRMGTGGWAPLPERRKKWAAPSDNVRVPVLNQTLSQT